MNLAAALRSLKHRLMYGPAVNPVKEAARIRREDRSLYETVRKHLTLPELPELRGAICGVAMVKNEVDVVERTLRQLLEQGIDELLVSDNGSTDGTLELLKELRGDLPLHIARDGLSAYEQSVKMTVLADAVTDRECAWVVPFDADELWMGNSGTTVREVLLSSAANIVAADMFNVFPRPEGGDLWNLDPSGHPDRKVAFRASAGAVLAMGNHSVLRPGPVGEGLAIIHLPWRSFEQFERKVIQGAQALKETSLPEDLGWHWRKLGDGDSATRRVMWEDLLRGADVPGNAWSARGATVPFNITALEPLPWDLASNQARRSPQRE